VLGTAIVAGNSAVFLDELREVVFSYRFDGFVLVLEYHCDLRAKDRVLL
jgi:hypothetical protein